MKKLNSCPLEIKRIERFIKTKTKGLCGGVIGLSGGIDSTVVAYLAARALGKENVCGLLLPHGGQSIEDGRMIAENLGIGYRIVDIKSIVSEFEGISFESFYGYLSKGNLMARVRMCFLYGVANSENKLVIGTTNRSELAIGYFTKYGDGGVDIEPIAHLYKTQVIELARELEIPEKIILKEPSAEVWYGQTDRNELGFDYQTLDAYLQGRVIVKEIADKIDVLIKNSRHKRCMPSNLMGKGV